MRIVMLALLVLAVALPVLACSGIGCTEIGCQSEAVFTVPSDRAAADEAVTDFCDRVSGTLYVDDQAYPISPGSWPEFDEGGRRWYIDCGLADVVNGWDAEPGRTVVVLDLGYTAQYEVGLELVDTDGARLTAVGDDVTYTRSQPNGDGCGPICRYATADLTVE